MPADTGLYGRKRPTDLSSGTELSSTTSLSFTSELSSLIASSSSTVNRAAGSKRPKSAKDDIFTSHNRNIAKRSKRDLEPDSNNVFEQKHNTKGENVESDVLKRNRRKMQEKARIYAAMQRGDLEDVDGKYAVDFDGKWAEEQDARDHGTGGKPQAGSNDSDEDDDSVEEERVEYVDEFGRTRSGTRIEALIAKQAASFSTRDATTARPNAPANVIYGDTIQHQAFDPAASRAEAIASLARKRDASLTPPPEEHFDAAREIRTKGTGFFQFSGAQEERARQMAELEAERRETERARAGREEERKEKFDERKEAIAKRREEVMRRSAKRKAGEFLEELLGSKDPRSEATVNAAIEDDKIGDKERVQAVKEDNG